MSRSTSQSSSTTATIGHTRSVSLKTTNPNSTQSNLLPVSNVKLFVTNLCLLDLDVREDWPDISVQTFSTKDVQQNQKQRIRCVEWALFRLFEIWDFEETKDKLQPFFPPLEPLQSLNLRAALYRCLNELKKNGVLGRESVLRKSMLDECKDTKFYEVLVLFSSAVLKKVTAQRKKRRGSQKHTAVARGLAVATSLNNERQKSLLPLAIVHKAALANILREKDEKRRKYSEFSELLEKRRHQIDQRNQKCKANPRKSILVQKETAAIKKQLQDNWIGNARWLDTMLHGDDVPAEDAFLSTSFSKVWRMVEEGRKMEEANPDPGLLETLGSRVEEHRARLQKWKAFHQRVLDEQAAPKKLRQTESTNNGTPAVYFKFNDHLNFQLLPLKEAKDGGSIKERLIRPEYRDIVSSMEEELLKVAKAGRNRSALPHLPRRGSSYDKAQSPSRRRKSRSNSTPKKSAELPKPEALLPKNFNSSKAPSKYKPPLEQLPTPLDSEATLVGAANTSSRFVLPAPEPTPPRTDHDDIPETSDPLPTLNVTRTHPSETTTTLLPPRSPSPPLQSPSPPASYYPSEPPLLNEEDALAEQIVGSIGDATPSPVKPKPRHQPRLSLSERARLSMAHSFKPVPPIEESPDPDPLPELPSAVNQSNPMLDRRASLLERTRQSMSLTTAQPKQKQRKSRASRQSQLFPVNQFETPRSRKSIQAIEESRDSERGETTPKEDLFSDEVEYEKVFKSRPRVQHSPVLSPALAEYVDVTGVDLDDVDEDDEGMTEMLDNSPLSRRRAH